MPGEGFFRTSDTKMGVRRMKRIVAAAALGLSLGVSGLAFAEPVKIGMITTTSGGGAGLGIDVRDAFQLAIKQSGNTEIEVIVEDDAQKPERAVQIADKMVQGEQGALLTGVIAAHPPTALAPSVTAR